MKSDLKLVLLVVFLLNENLIMCTKTGTRMLSRLKTKNKMTTKLK